MASLLEDPYGMANESYGTTQYLLDGGGGGVSYTTKRVINLNGKVVVVSRYLN